MPYGQSRTFGGTRTRRSSTLARQKAARSRVVSKTRNKPVRRVYRKAATAPRTRTGANKSAIFTLARQVKALQLSRMGSYQKNYEHVSILDGGDHGLFWNKDRPLIFAANDFLDESYVYVGCPDNVSAPGSVIPGFAPKVHWEKYTPSGITGLNDYDYWAHANDDSASTTAYRAISTDIKFALKAPNLAGDVQYWVRIDLVKTKRTLLHSNSRKLSLPQNIMALGNLAADDMHARNRYNREFFTVLQTKWIKLDNKNNDMHETIQRWCTMHIKFPERSPTEKLDIHKREGDVDHPAIHESFISNMPPPSVYWVILSTSNVHGESNVKVEMTRVTRYRDNSGVAA